MKKILTLLIFLGYCLHASSQDTSIDLKNLYIPSSPAFNLLDISPTFIERPTTVKAFTLNVASAIGKEQGIPKNYAIEVAPFWLLRHPKMTVFKNFGINTKNHKTTQNIFYGLRNTSISIGTITNDSSKINPYNVTYLSYSLKTNIISYRNKKVIKTLYHTNMIINEKLTNGVLFTDSICRQLGYNPLSKPGVFLKCVDSLISIDRKLPDSSSAYSYADSMIEIALNLRPVISLDAAIASSMGFYDNTFSNNHHYRTGGWLTFSFSHPLDKGSRHDIEKLAKAKNYFNAYALVRTLSEDSTSDMKTFKRYNYLDYGIRAEFEFNRFALSFEHVQRKVAHDNSLNSARNVGIVQYKIDDNLYFTGTFGKNFGEQNNLIAFFGISWGLGKTAVYDRFNRNTPPAH